MMDSLKYKLQVRVGWVGKGGWWKEEGGWGRGKMWANR